MNLCIDCKHHKETYYDHLCNHPNNFVLSPVTGEKRRIFNNCIECRYEVNEGCSKEGKWFEGGTR